VSDLAEALNRNFTSPNVSDSNLEAANLVDTTDRIARALMEIARALDRLTETLAVRHDSSGGD
jgi:hypothetical protein